MALLTTIGRRLAYILRSVLPPMPELAIVLRSNGIFGILRFIGMTVARSRIPVQVKVRSIPIFVRPCTPDLAVAETCFSGELDAAIAAVKPLKHRFLIDAGSYIGSSAIILAKSFPDATILSLEPSRQNFDVLVMNVSAYTNVIPLNMALGSSLGVTQLVDRRTGEVGFSIIQAPADCAAPLSLHEVAVTTISALMKQFNASGVDLLKLDVEGAEHDLFQTGSTWLSHTRVVLVELHDRIVPGCEAVFLKATAGRINSIDSFGEKVLSKHPELAAY